MYDTIIELRVRNHPGVMSKITGLFARRNFNLEGILCRPEEDEGQSRMILFVYENTRTEQLVKQLGKLYDVLSVSVRPDRERQQYTRLFQTCWNRGRLALSLGRCFHGWNHRSII